MFPGLVNKVFHCCRMRLDHRSVFSKYLSLVMLSYFPALEAYLQD